MVDTELLEPLLPEIFTAIRGERAQYFWKMLEVLDRTVQAGRKIPDAVLLSVLMLPWVIDEIEREEARRESRMRIVEVIPFIRDLTQPLCARMSLPAGTRHQIEQAMETLWRLLEPPSDRAPSSALSPASRSTTRCPPRALCPVVRAISTSSASGRRSPFAYVARRKKGSSRRW